MLLEAARSSFLLVDAQARLMPAMAKPDEVVRNGSVLVKAAARLNVPITVTEQYPKGLGTTVAAFAEILPNEAVTLPKTAFSGMSEPLIAERLLELRAAGRDQAVVAGVEAHVCVLQTAMELKRAGFEVYVAGDAVSSRSPHSVEAARARLVQSGCAWVTMEMVVFEWLGRAATDEFRALSPLVKS
jgi:nicotinamidase-related amidase